MADIILISFVLFCHLNFYAVFRFTMFFHLFLPFTLPKSPKVAIIINPIF